MARRSARGRFGESAAKNVLSVHDRNVGRYSRAKRVASLCLRNSAAKGQETTRVSHSSRRRPARYTRLVVSVSGLVNSSTVLEYWGSVIRRYSSALIVPSAAKHCHKELKVSNILTPPVLPRYRPASSFPKLTRTSRPPDISSRARFRRIVCQSLRPCSAKAASSAPSAPTAWTWLLRSQGLRLSPCIAVVENPRLRVPMGRIGR